MRGWKNSWLSPQTWRHSKPLKTEQVQLASGLKFSPAMLMHLMRQRYRIIRGHTTTQTIQHEVVWLHESLNALRKACFWEWPKSAVCVQRSIDSRNSASHNAYRTLLRPSSMLEPRDPSLHVVRKTTLFYCINCCQKVRNRNGPHAQLDKAETAIQATMRDALSNNRTTNRRQMKKWLRILNVSMILPQVHLRKPCYDFSFL